MPSVRGGLIQRFSALNRLALAAAFFVVRTKENILIERRYSHPVDTSTGVRSDQTVTLAAAQSAKAHPDALRRVHYRDPVTGKPMRYCGNSPLAPERVREVLNGLPTDAVERVPLSEEIGRLRDVNVREGVLGRASRSDAEHVASASMAVANLPIGWNF